MHTILHGIFKIQYCTTWYCVQAVILKYCPTLLLSYLLVQAFSQSILTHNLGTSNHLSKLDPHKASGLNGMPTRLLKELTYSVALVLALIFNTSLHQSNLPVEWKTATVIPVFMKGSQTDSANYRLISLACVCCKVFEYIVSSAIPNHANLHNIICTEQHGFRKHWSCQTQLCHYQYSYVIEQ